jgi:hypothetical protein
MANWILFTAQVVAGIMAVVVIARSFEDWRKGNDSWPIFLFWTVAAGGILAVALFPQLVDWAIGKLGGQRTGIGTIFGLGLVFLFYLSYRIFVKADRVEKEMTRLTRELALKNLKKK